MPNDDNWQDAPPKRPTWLDNVRDFYAFTLRGRYFWVRDVEGGCGPVYASLDEAVQEALFEVGGLSGAVAGHGPEAVIEVLEVRRGDRYQRLWCSDPGLMDAPIKTQPEEGVDTFPREWVQDAEPRSTRMAAESRHRYEDPSGRSVHARIQKD